MFGGYRLVFVQLLLVIVVAVTGWLLARLAERMYGHRVARLAGLVYVIVSIWGPAHDTQAANTELFLNLPLVAAGLLTLRGRGALLFAAGFLTGIAGLYKYQAVLAGGAWLLVVVLDGQPYVVRRVALLGAGFLSVVAAYLAFFYVSGTWDSFVFWGWSYNFRYIDTLSAGQTVWNAARAVVALAACWSPLLLCLRRPVREQRLVWLWLGMMGLAITIGGRFFPHYFLMALPPLCVLVVPGVLDRRRRRLKLALASVLTAASLVWAWNWYALWPGLGDEIDTYQHVATYVRVHSSPDDRVFVWGDSPELYLFSERGQATRFPSSNYHTGKIWGSPLIEADATDTDRHVVTEAWPELLDDLQREHPLFIIDAAEGGMSGFEPPPDRALPSPGADRRARLSARRQDRRDPDLPSHRPLLRPGRGGRVTVSARARLCRAARYSPPSVSR